jgi:NAD(P)-dependent dehydrogenase (short-subunit alcohol dehydrogenase family)
MKRLAVVTGVSGSIGTAVANTMRAAGWQVAGIDRKESGAGHCDRFVQLDLSRWSDIGPALLELVGDDPVAALVNNAGVQLVQPVESISDRALEDTFAVNVFAPIVAVRALTANLQAAHGAVVNVASVHATATSRGMSAYAASKAALTGFTRGAALDLGPVGIRINAVLPGAVDTRMLREGMMAREGSLEMGLSQLAKATPLGRVGRPEEIADLVVYLCEAGKSSFITGQCFVIDGGATTRLGTE